MLWPQAPMSTKFFDVCSELLAAQKFGTRELQTIAFPDPCPGLPLRSSMAGCPEDPVSLRKWLVAW